MDARQLIFDMFATRLGMELRLPELLRAGAAFSISEGALRTALARLKSEGRVEQRQRGSYVLVGSPAPLLRRISEWKHVLSRRRPWLGAWIVVVSGSKARLDRTIWRRTLRGFALEGLRQFDSDTFARPDNLVDGAAGIRRRLKELQVSDSILVGSMADIDADITRQWIDAWPIAAIRKSHLELTITLESSMRTIGRRVDDTAAAETLLLGRRAVRAILEDPLLPPQLGSDLELRQLIAAMTDYDAFGKSIWASYLELHRKRL